MVLSWVSPPSKQAKSVLPCSTTWRNFRFGSCWAFRANQTKMEVGPAALLRLPGMPNMTQALFYNEGPAS